jgi:PPOX class probable F420-dependent enzyme
MLDDGSEFGARVARRLREEMIVWLTTVTPSGAPLPRPVGFLWDGGDDVLVYSQPGARIRNIARNPKVTLNFDGDGHGGDIVVLSGTAEVDESVLSAAENAAWVAKYATEWERLGMTEGRTRSASAPPSGFASPPSTGAERPALPTTHVRPARATRRAFPRAMTSTMPGAENRVGRASSGAPRPMRPRRVAVEPPDGKGGQRDQAALLSPQRWTRSQPGARAMVTVSRACPGAARLG